MYRPQNFLETEGYFSSVFYFQKNRNLCSFFLPLLAHIGLTLTFTLPDTGCMGRSPSLGRNVVEVEKCQLAVCCILFCLLFPMLLWSHQLECVSVGKDRWHILILPSLQQKAEYIVLCNQILEPGV